MFSYLCTYWQIMSKVNMIVFSIITKASYCIFNTPNNLKVF